VDTILVVEDNRSMQKTLQRLFEGDSLQVIIASDGIAGLESFRKQTPTAVVLDLKLPLLHGRELCRHFKSLAPCVPIVIVSADSDVDDKVLLLELGADDYVTKPFSPKELLARVRRAMRRNEAPAQIATNIASDNSEHEVLSFGEVHIDFTSMEAIRAGEPLALTHQEFKLLKFFARSMGKVISRDQLLNEVWGFDNYPTTRTVDNQILRLRQKLEPDPAVPQYFLTIRGAGYKFIRTQAAPVEPTSKNGGAATGSPDRQSDLR
jgi:DNA-binding response OmpR family regulator